MAAVSSHGGSFRMRGRPGWWTPLVVATLLLNGCWFQPGWGPGRAGHNADEDQLTLANVATLQQGWSIDLGASPALHPVMSEYGVHAVSGDTVTTVALADGSTRWTYAIDLGPRDTVGSPSMGGVPNNQHWLHVPIIRYDSPDDQEVYGSNAVLDPATGAVDTTMGRFGDNGSIAVDGEMASAIARVERNIDEPPRPWATLILSYGNYVYRWWDVLLANGPTEDVPTALGRDRIVFGLDDQVQAFARTGCYYCQALWTTDLGATATTPALSNASQTVFVGDSSGGVSALNLIDGSVRWTADLGGDRSIVAPPSIGYGQLYVTSSDGRLHSFDAGGCGAPTCGPTWVADVGGEVEMQAALAGGVVYVATTDGTLHALDANGCGAAECPLLWSSDTGSRITGGPVVSDGHLLVGTEDGRLIAYRPA
jgi:outer membrane protein assembly factor BamB